MGWALLGSLGFSSAGFSWGPVDWALMGLPWALIDWALPGPKLVSQKKSKVSSTNSVQYTCFSMTKLPDEGNGKIKGSHLRV